MPVSPVFHIDVVAQAADIDQLEHVSNQVYLRWVLEVAERHSTAVGYDLPAYRQLGAVFVVRRHELDYLRPCYRDERIRVSTWVDSWRAASTVRLTRIVRRVDPADGSPDHDDDDAGSVELARAKTVWAFVDMVSGRPTRIPAALREIFAGPATAADSTGGADG
ncbi:MAG: acyl-CoA thioesterase [Myxococcota bacterium]